MDFLMLMTTIERNIIIRQSRINRICDEIEYHNKMVARHYNYSIERVFRHNYLKEELNKLMLEKRAYKLATNMLLRKEK